MMAADSLAGWGQENRMAKTTKRQPWTKEDVRTLKTLAREKTKTTVIARKLKRTERATYQKAAALGVMLGGGRGKKA
jgi:SPX domain protein involved in polyphosphate accumulation